MAGKMHIIFYPLLLLIACTPNNQNQRSNYFEGRIVYTNSVESKGDSTRAVALKKLSGDSSVFYFKEGSFKQFYNADGLLEETYDQKSNRAYIKKNNTDSLFWYDCSEPGGKILKYEINKNREQVLGVNCDELVTHYANKTISYYYNSDSLRINKDWFKAFNFSNKNFVTEKMGTLFLKCKMEYPYVIFSITASSITHEEIPDKLFEISKNAVLVYGR